MVRSRIAALPKRSRRSLSDVLAPASTAPPSGPSQADVDDKPSPPKRPHKGPGVKLWGFVRRHEDARETAVQSELMPQDIAIWYDKKRSRFEIVADHKVIDDLAPVEFVQFVRALRYSNNQILFKFDNRVDGTAGRPVSVWSSQPRSGAA